MLNNEITYNIIILKKKTLIIIIEEKISIFSFIACTKYETEKLIKEDEKELEQVRKIYVAKYDKKKEKFKLVEVLSNQPYSIEILDMLQGEYLEEKIETDRDMIVNLHMVRYMKALMILDQGQLLK